MNRLCKATFIVWLAASALTAHQAIATDTSPSQYKTANPYAGYDVDGRTSASVLAAKRSHAVSTNDENLLAVFSGILAIGMIVFLVHVLQKPK